MSFKFKSVFRKKPGTEEGKYYPSLSSVGRVGIDQLAQEAGNLTSVNQTDVKAVISALFQVIPQNLMKGLIVDLGEMGSFTVKAKSDGMDTPEEVKASCLSDPTIRFIIKRKFSNTIRDIQFEKID